MLSSTGHVSWAEVTNLSPSSPILDQTQEDSKAARGLDLSVSPGQRCIQGPSGGVVTRLLMVLLRLYSLWLCWLIFQCRLGDLYKWARKSFKRWKKGIKKQRGKQPRRAEPPWYSEGVSSKGRKCLGGCTLCSGKGWLQTQWFCDKRFWPVIFLLWPFLIVPFMKIWLLALRGRQHQPSVSELLVLVVGVSWLL